MASTAYAHAYDVSGSSCPSTEMPCHTETTAPAPKSPNAANIDQTYASRP